MAVDPDDDSIGSAWLGGLIKAPVVRQFLHNGHLYKEEEERTISHFELFADLVFVAVIHVSGRWNYSRKVFLTLLDRFSVKWPRKRPLFGMPSNLS